jgi:PadR family transcriptional regulator, regulatory protein PadR
MCLLALLGQSAAHGYDLVKRLEAAGIGGVGYGTVYPLLTRLRKLGFVADELQDSPAVQREWRSLGVARAWSLSPQRG